MVFQTLRSMIVVAALCAPAFTLVEAQAQCCGGATTAFYQPTPVTAFSPVVVQQSQPGWYPGFFLDRIRTRLWGAPNTFVAVQPTTFVAARPVFATSYVANFAPVSSCSGCSSFTASYSPCSTCAPVQQVTMQPVCGCDPCSTCSSCPTSQTFGVSQASYQEPSGCNCATNGTTIVVPNGTVVTPGSQQSSMSTGQPQIPANEPTPAERSMQKVPANGSGQEVETPPAGDATGDGSNGDQTSEGSESATFFQAPKLFDPNDRTAQRRIAPVRTALYEKPAGYQPVSAKRATITSQQAERDAAGWTSASN
jgi:hypothetical protein